MVYRPRLFELREEGRREHPRAGRNQGLEESFSEILVPTEDVVEIRRGRKINAERKFFPGYVLVKMDLSDQAYHLIKNTPKVTGFLGSGLKPMPVSEKEVARIIGAIEEGVERPKPTIQFEIGETVRVTDGPFASFNGSVEQVDEDRARLRVTVSIFGRATPVELEYVTGGEDRARPVSIRLSPHVVERFQSRHVQAGGSGRASQIPRTTKSVGGRHPHHGSHRVRIESAQEEIMAKKILGYIKLQVKAGSATPSPPIGPALGQRGVNIMGFCKEFNARTENVVKGTPLPTVITVYQDKSFTFVTKTPPATHFLKEIVGIKSGSGKTGVTFVGDVTRTQLREIAEKKMKDLNANDIEAAARIIEGSAKAMGLRVVEA